jgi:hypothetical protein
MQPYNFATFWVEQWMKFLSAAGTWPAVDRESLDAQLAELRAGADRVEAELKSVADERTTLRRDLAAAEEAAKAALDDFADAKAELTQVRERAAEERKRHAAEVAGLQRKAAEAAAAERKALAAAHDGLAGERDKLAAELARVRAAAEEERQRLEAVIGDMRTKTVPAGSTDVEVAAGLDLHFKKPPEWGEPPFVHYWDKDRRTTWPGEPMIAEGDDWYVRTLPGVRSATVVFNDNGGHQTPDLARDRSGWYDGKWRDEKPGRSRRAARKEPE